MAGTTCTSARSYFKGMNALLSAIDHDAIDEFGHLLYEIWRERRRVFVFGNGGSAMTASHHVCDFVKTAAVNGQPRLEAISLVDNVGLLTAVGNDIGYDDTFRYALESMAHASDIVVAISCSGNSSNVVKACEWAKRNGLVVVALTGFDGGRIGKLANIHINVPSENYGLIEDLHMSIGHVVAQSLHASVGNAEVGA